MSKALQRTPTTTDQNGRRSSLRPRPHPVDYTGYFPPGSELSPGTKKISPSVVESGSSRSNGHDKNHKRTPTNGDNDRKRRLSLLAPTSQNTSLCLTPQLSKIITDHTIAENSPRHTPSVSNVMNTPSSENYFIAEKRLKFQTPASAKAVKLKKVREATKTKVKRPRKGNRQGIDKIKTKLPAPPPPDFSVTKEAAKIPEDAECVFPWVEDNSTKLEALLEEITKDFPRWFLYLREGFNIMLHGYGSKQQVFDSLDDYLGNEFNIVSINGLFKHFNARKFLSDFVESLNCETKVRLSGHNVNSSVDGLVEELSEYKSHDPVFIFVMNFDVLAIRHPQMLTALCTFARVPYIHIIASCNHVNAGLGISPTQTTQLNFVWFDCTTLMPYTNELIWLGSVFGESNDTTAGLNALEHIFKSLTTNAKKAFGILAKLQLQKMKTKKKGKTFDGVEFKEVSRLCREGFIAHSDLVLKTLLSEFVDHKLINYSGKGKNDDNLTIDLDEETLQKYAQN